MSELTKKLMAIITPMLASDEKPEDVEKKVQKVVEDEATQAEKDNESEAERLKREEKELKEREERERKDRDRDRKEAEDEDDDGKEKKKAEDEDDDEEDKAAMDAALIRKAEENVMGRIRQANEARECVRPLVGDVSLVAMDSAESIYRFALDSIGSDHKGVHPSALKSMVEFTISQKSEARKPVNVIGMDSAATTSFAKAFPGATKMKRS